MVDWVLGMASFAGVASFAGMHTALWKPCALYLKVLMPVNTAAGILSSLGS